MKKTFLQFDASVLQQIRAKQERQKYKQRKTWGETKQYCSVGENHSLGLIPYQMLGEYLPIISKSKQKEMNTSKT